MMIPECRAKDTVLPRRGNAQHFWRIAGNIAFLGSGFKAIARLADCDLATAGVQACDGNNIALKAEIRFRVRF